MRLQWLLFAALAAGVSLVHAATHEAANCGYSGVEVTSADRADLVAACTALTDVLTYFRSIGFDFKPSLSVKFVERTPKPAEGAVAYGHADVRASLVIVQRSSHRQPWGLEWDKEIMGSFLRHELAHLAAWQILGRDAGRLRREWHEFIAYAIQLDLMDARLLPSLLAKYPDAHAFNDLSEVNEFIYGMNPDMFAVIAYLTYRDKGGREFIRRLLRGEIVPPAASFPFPVLPHEASK